MKSNKTIKVKFNKSHPKLAYFEGDVAKIPAQTASKYKLLEKGYVINLPVDGDVDDINKLPEDIPSRDILFEAGYDTIEKIKKAGESLIDVKGIGKGTLKQIESWFEEHK
jgi:hypothetical protein